MGWLALVQNKVQCRSLVGESNGEFFGELCDYQILHKDCYHVKF